MQQGAEVKSKDSDECEQQLLLVMGTEKTSSLYVKLCHYFILFFPIVALTRKEDRKMYTIIYF